MIKVIEFSFDDGLREDLLIAKLFRKYSEYDPLFKVVFYIPNNCNLADYDIISLSQDFEIGGHTVSHPSDLKLLSDDDLKFEIESNKIWLEKIIKRKITKFCYPRGRHDARVMKAVLDAGYTEARTTVVNNTGFGGFDKHTTLHFYPRLEYNGDNPFGLAKNYINAYKEGEYLRFWGHSRELLDNYGIEPLEDLLKFICQIH